jgi:hypothetical protein
LLAIGADEIGTEVGMTSSVKIASRVNAVVASEVQRAEDLALIAGVLVARGLRPRKAERLLIDALDDRFHESCH